MIEAKQLLLDALDRIAATVTDQTTYGMCKLLNIELSLYRHNPYELVIPAREQVEALDGAYRLMSIWPLHSGNKAYPVPSSRPDLSPGDAYHINCARWDSTTQYGRDRRRLLLWMRRQLAAELGVTIQ